MTKFLICLSLISNIAFAHGENKLGPHQGYIRMPSMYHTELVPVTEKEFNIYLMNVNNTDATIQNSSAELILSSNEKIIDQVKCQAKADHFNCTLLKSSNIKNGKLIIKSQRNKDIGKDAVYDLPLALK